MIRDKVGVGVLLLLQRVTLVIPDVCGICAASYIPHTIRVDFHDEVEKKASTAIAKLNVYQAQLALYEFSHQPMQKRVIELHLSNVIVRAYAVSLLFQRLSLAVSLSSQVTHFDV